ncbi:hypothetical protein [Pseudomonas guariconensis]|uniref:hypothetical protein n=1 Tax=Pseudomonas guariconensis TaxID=1288410 RepID=UPI002B05E773|nr:hypothetical protein [Pseudomonas guariconensis]
MGKKIGKAICWFMAFAGLMSCAGWFATNALAAILALLSAVLFCPLTWSLTKKASGREIHSGAFVVAALAVMFAGSSMMAKGDKDLAAEQGFASVADYKAATKLGLDAEAYAKHKAEAEAAEKQKAELAKTAEAKKESDCRNDLQCWAQKNELDAIVTCKRAIESLAKYDFEWTDGITAPIFARLSWGDKARGEIIYIGDQVKFQNGFGNFLKHKYACKFDPVAKVAINATADPGRL